MSVSCIHQGSEMGVFDRAVPLFNKALILVRVSECCMQDKCAATGEGEGSKPHSRVGKG